MKRKTILKTALWSTASVSAYFFTANATIIHLYHHKDPEIQEYVEQNLEKIIKEQEQKIIISYPAERPKIEYIFPREYLSLGASGIYNDKNNTMYLPSGLLTKPEWDWGDLAATFFTFNSTADAKRVVDHELAHFYCDTIKEKVLGKNYHLLETSYFIYEERIASQLINEGIAKYFENRMNGEDKKPLRFEEWPTELNGFSNHVIYNGGYAVVKPVIDQYGEKGIQFLLFNPPTSKELFTPEEYQQRILRDIAKL